MSDEAKGTETFDGESSLIPFFRDLVRHEPRYGEIQGVLFYTEAVGSKTLHLFSLFWNLLAVGGLEKLRARPPGIYVTVRFPVSFHVGFFASSRPQENPAGTGLQLRYFVDALDSSGIDEFFVDERLSLFLELATKYTVRMTDEAVSFGPVGMPEDDASMLARIAAALKRTTDGEEEGPVADDRRFDTERAVLLRKADSTVAADLIAATLNAEGIPVRFEGYSQGAMFGDSLGGFGGISILVPSSEEERARAILDEDVNAPIPSTE